MSPDLPRPVSSTWFQRLARRAVVAKMGEIGEGVVTLRETWGGGETFRCGRPTTDGDVAEVRVHEPTFWTDMLLGGSVGAAESYIEASWDADDLAALVRIMVRNMSVLDGLEGGLAWLSKPLTKAGHLLRANTRKGSRANIAAHYDLGNDFFELFLDDTMTYSCGVFGDEGTSMGDASIAKIDRLCRKLDLKPDDHLLEIGTGWGALAIHAARTYGCRVTTTTISAEQHAIAKQRIEEAGLSDRVTLLMQDYRDLEGTYDKLVSVEMIEAVGHQFLDTYLSTCSRLLKPDGMMALQAITIADQHYESALRDVDFIKKYVFPGSFIPSVTAISNAMAGSTDLRLFHLEDFAPHYARTLWNWRQTLYANLDAIRDRGYDEAFLRMWEYYLCYCEGGFDERYIGVVQMVLTKPRCRRAPILPEIAAPSTTSEVSWSGAS